MTHPVPAPARYTTTTRMLAHAQLAGLRHSGWFFWSLVIQVVLYVALIVMHASDGSGLRDWPGAVWVFFLIWSLASTLLMPYVSAAWSIRYMPTSWRDRSISVDASGVSMTGGDFSGTIVWSYVSRVVETREFFLFITGPGLTAFVPRSAFATPQAREDFRRVLVEATRFHVAGAG